MKMVSATSPISIGRFAATSAPRPPISARPQDGNGCRSGEPARFRPVHAGRRAVNCENSANKIGVSGVMWTLPPSDSVLHLLSLVALAAQAMTAALAAGRRSMDWVGVCMLGCITALGGGTIRDVLLGHYPLVWVQNPSYLALTAIAAFATILIARAVHRLSLAFLVLDAIGLVVFTMAGSDASTCHATSQPTVIVS